MNFTPIDPIPSAPQEAAGLSSTAPIGVQASANHCALCYSRSLCVSAAACAPSQESRLAGRRIRVPRDGALYRQGDLVDNRYYVVHYGSFKTYHGDQADGQRITGFQLNADCLALDAIGLQQHRGSAIALEDSEVCEILYTGMQPILQGFHALLSKEIGRERQLSFLLRDTSADQRLAAFLLEWSERLRARGLSATSFMLRMTRQDIADHLSMTRESVSRGLVRFQRKGLLTLDGRELIVRDPERLRQVAHIAPAALPAAPT
jgi:CRP/FNR family transcriptional regulator